MNDIAAYRPAILKIARMAARREHEGNACVQLPRTGLRPRVTLIGSPYEME
jgi:hypothetical protein